MWFRKRARGSSAQIWNATALGDGGWQIRVAHTGQCLDVEGGALGPGAQLIQWPCGPGPNQYFDITTSGGLSTIVARHSGLCLDVFGGSVEPGAELIQWTCTSGANQRFNLVGGNNDGGRWTPRIDLPLVPVAASALTNGNILMWSAYDRFTFGGDRGLTQTLTFDPSSFRLLGASGGKHRPRHVLPRHRQPGRRSHSRQRRILVSRDQHLTTRRPINGRTRPT